MSKFLGKSAAALTPYVPGEQLTDRVYIKLNANECPYPPSPGVERALKDAEYRTLRLYPDAEAKALHAAVAKFHGLTPQEVFMGAGSDEVLGYAFMAFFDKGDKVCYPGITYGFYPIYAQLCGLEAVEIPVREDFTIAVSDYYGLDGNIIIANPNAPTSLAITPEEVEDILRHNPDRLVIIDEAYADFSENRTAVPLLRKYDNLMVVQTFSKSRAMAGMRVACALGNPELMAGLTRIKFSFNPFNLDPLAIATGIASVEDKAYLAETVGKIKATRNRAGDVMRKMGMTVLPSETNFLFAKHPAIPGGELCRLLKAEGILIRHFSKPGIDDYVRITVGTDGDMDTLLEKLGALT